MEAGPSRCNAKRAGDSSLHLPAGRVIARVREANREGMLAKLEHLDERYLSKFFLGGAKKAKELEMSEVRVASTAAVALAF